MKRISFFFIVMISTLLLTQVQPAQAFTEVSPGVCECNSCEDCSAAFGTAESEAPQVPTGVTLSEAPIVCDHEIRLTQDIDISDNPSTCIYTSYIDSHEVTLDCQDHTITGGSAGGFYGIYPTYSTNLTIKNCTVRGFDIGLYMNSLTNANILNNTFDENTIRGIFEQSGNSNTFENNVISNTTYEGCGVPPASFHISQVDNQGNTLVSYTQSYTTQYETHTFPLTNNTGQVSVSISQKDKPFADVDQISLTACNICYQPSFVRYADTQKDIMEQTTAIDNEVVNAHERTIEASWNIPLTCTENPLLFVNANEYGVGSPLLYPHNGTFDYTLGTNTGIQVVDGRIDPHLSSVDPTFVSYWKPGSGHPFGNTYIYVQDDSKAIYLTLDITSDNTNDPGKDWIEIETQNGVFPTIFHVDDLTQTYGICSFTKTDKVSYTHKVCELRIPKNELFPENTNHLNFKVRYYGTVSGPNWGVTGMVISNSMGDTLTDNVIYGSCWYGLGLEYSSSLNLQSNMFCGNSMVDISNYDGSPESTGDNNSCMTSDAWTDVDEDSGCTNNPLCYSMTLEKTAPEAMVDEGDTVTYTYTLANTGYLPIESITLFDDTCSPTDFPETTLNPQESMQATCSMPLTINTTNTAEADGLLYDYSVGQYIPISATDSLTIQVYTDLTPEHIGGQQYNPGTGTYQISPGQTIVVDGTTEPGATVVVEIDGTARTCTVTADGTGHFSCSLQGFSNAGSHLLVIKSTAEGKGETVLGAYTLMVGLSDTGIAVGGAVIFGLFVIASLLLPYTKIRNINRRI